MAYQSAANQCYLQRKLVFCLIEDLGRGNGSRRPNRNRRSSNKHTSFEGGSSGSSGLSARSLIGALGGLMPGGTAA